MLRGAGTKKARDVVAGLYGLCLGAAECRWPLHPMPHIGVCKAPCNGGAPPQAVVLHTLQSQGIPWLNPVQKGRWCLHRLPIKLGLHAGTIFVGVGLCAMLRCAWTCRKGRDIQVVVQGLPWGCRMSRAAACNATHRYCRIHHGSASMWNSTTPL